jgi:hypothetical protein
VALHGAEDKRRRPWTRHVDGWQVGAIAVTIALLGTLLGLPLPVEPKEIPLPRVDRAGFARDTERFRVAAHRARRESLPFAVRAVGEAYRAVGRAEAAGNRPDFGATTARLRQLTRAALIEHGASAILSLRSVQTELFLRAVARWEATGATSLELDELGGQFAQRARAAWLDESGRLGADAHELASVFIVRWTGLAGALEDDALEPTLNTWRLYFRFQLETGTQGVEPDARAQFELETVRALGRRDPKYPLSFALGVLAFRLGNYADAQAAFRAHLSDHPSGPWALRARNHLAAALVRGAPQES